MTNETFEFTIVSKKYGSVVVTAPSRFRVQIEARTWHVRFRKNRAKGRQFEVSAHQPGSRPIFLHRFIWSLAGHDPVPQIDHRDGQPLNNAEDNLRDGTGRNSMNLRSLRKDNTSGVVGVCWEPRYKRWRATVKAKGKVKHVGLFVSLDAATAARDAAARTHYGDFAVLNEEMRAEEAAAK